MNASAIALINYIQDADQRKLVKWEKDYIVSLDKNVKLGWAVTPKQIKCLEEIYRKVTGGGQYAKRQYV